MNKKKKSLIILVISFVLLLIFLAILILFNISKDVNLDLENINNKMLEKGDFNISNMKDIDLEYIKNTLDIDNKYVVQYIGKIPILEISSSMYIVIETNSKEEASIVFDKLNLFAINYEQEWSSFLLSERQIVENRRIGKKGKYVYLIINDNALELEKML